MDKPVRILLLGPPEVIVKGKPVSIKRRLNRALLYYLAAQPHPASRSELCEKFWPHEDEEKSRKNLREALSRLRLDLGIPNLIITSGDFIYLDPAMLDVDLLTYQHAIIPLLSSAEFNASGTLPDWIVQELKRTLALCRAPRLMQGINLIENPEFENWLEFNNHAYNVSMKSALDRLIDHYISSGNLEEAVVWLGTALQSDPLDDEMNFLMLICLRDMGKLDEMVNTANYIEGVYARHEEALPDKIRELKNQALTSRETPTNISSSWPFTEREAPDFVGREFELDTLSKALRGRGIVLVEGEAGIGKTRLLKQFFSAQPFPPRLFYCVGHPLAVRVAFQAIVNALRTQIQDEEWYKLPESDRQILDDFYHRVLQDPEGPGVISTETNWLPVLEDVFFAFAHLMEIAAARRPLLFIVDDAIWADLASISLISFLIDRGFFDRFGLLVFANSPDVINEPLELLLQRVRRVRKLTTLKLSPFTDREIEGFVEKALGRLPAIADIERLRDMTGGNPYFLSECVRSAKWITTGEKVTLPAENCNPPDSVISLVHDKLHGLEADSVLLIKAAAILGKKFCPDVLEEMTGMDVDRVATGLDDLISEGFLRVNPDIHPLGGYSFRHDIEREVILADLTPGQKRSLHLKAARALQKRRAGFARFAEALAQHWETALQENEALNAWLEAGRYARSQFDRVESYRVYGRGLDMVMKAPTLFPENVVYELINEYGNYAFDRDDMVTCEKIYRGCLEIGEINQNRKLIGTAYNGLARAAFFRNEFEEARTCLERASWFLEGTDLRVEQIKTLYVQGTIQYSVDDFTASRRSMENALALTENVDDLYINDTKIDILTILCADLCYIGEPLTALEYAKQMVNLSSLATRRSTALQAAAVLAMCEYYNDHLENTVQIYQDSLVLMERFQLRFWCSVLDTSAALAYLEMGNLDEAFKLAEQAYDRETPYKSEKLSMHTAKALGDLFRLLDNATRAAGYYFENINSGAMNYQTIISKYYLGISLIDGGKRSEGQKWIDEAISESELKGLRGIESSMKMGRLVIAAERKPTAALIKDARQVLETINETKSAKTQFFRNSLEGHLSEAYGKTDEAIGFYQAAVAAENINGNVWYELLAYKRILALAPPNSPVRKSVEKRVNEIIESMQAHATHPALKGSFIKFRNKWKRYVNVMSTR